MASENNAVNVDVCIFLPNLESYLYKNIKMAHFSIHTITGCYLSVSKNLGFQLYLQVTRSRRHWLTQTTVKLITQGHWSGLEAILVNLEMCSSIWT